MGQCFVAILVLLCVCECHHFGARSHLTTSSCDTIGPLTWAVGAVQVWKTNHWRVFAALQPPVRVLVCAYFNNAEARCRWRASGTLSKTVRSYAARMLSTRRFRWRSISWPSTACVPRPAAGQRRHGADGVATCVAAATAVSGLVRAEHRSHKLRGPDKTLLEQLQH